MKMQKIESTDAFVAIDLPEATSASGIVRSARKILPDGAKNLARTLTYTFGRFGIEASGASAGINAVDPDLDAAIAAFASELAPLSAEGKLTLRAGKGVTATAIASLGATDEDESAALAAGIVAASRAVCDLTSTETSTPSVVVERGPSSGAIVSAFETAGITAAELDTSEALAAECSVLVVGSKPGLIDHDIAETLACAALLPSGPLPFTARALAVGERKGITMVPDFVAIAGPELIRAGVAADADAAGSLVAAVVAEDQTSDESLFMASCLAAEKFIGNWADALPFGRPLA